jgi:hypothetical protein
MREDGRQTTIVTSLAETPALEVVRALFQRWRQENFFKYMEDEFAIDALIEYGAEDVSADETRPNPRRAKLARRRKATREEIQRLRAEFGARMASNDENRATPESKLPQDELQARLGKAEARERKLKRRMKKLPKRVPAKGVKTLKNERRRIADAIKICAYQIETELYARLSKYYPRAADEGRTLLQEAFQACAQMRTTESELRITIAALSAPHRSAALAQLCAELNQIGACYPGTNLRLHLAVEGFEPLTK